MSESLHRITEQLRAEKCPPHVLAKIRERIAQERGVARRSPFTMSRLAWAGGLAVALAFAAVHWFSGGPGGNGAASAPGSGLTAAQVADQTHLSLACIGTSFVEAGNRTETILVNHVKPRLLDSLDKAAKAITNPFTL